MVSPGMRCVFTASIVAFLAAPRRAHKSKMHLPMQPGGTPDAPAAPLEPAERAQVPPSGLARRDPAQTGRRPHHRTRPPVRGRLRGLVGLP